MVGQYKIDPHKSWVQECGLDSYGFGQELFEKSCEHSSEPLNCQERFVRDHRLPVLARTIPAFVEATTQSP
jgi:hypothetical protein